MHRTALAFAVARFFAEQFGKHAVQRRSLGDAVSVPAMRARDVVIIIEGFAYADGDRFLTYIKVGETGHEGSRVQIIHLLLEEPDHDHPPIHMKPLLGFDFRLSFRSIYSRCHFETPCRNFGNSSSDDEELPNSRHSL